MYAEKNLDKTGATCRLETSPRKSLAQLAQQTILSASSVQNATKLPHLHPYNTTVVHKVYNTDCEARLNFANWYLHGVQVVQVVVDSLDLYLF
jgi:hypothetical protein